MAASSEDGRPRKVYICCKDREKDQSVGFDLYRSLKEIGCSPWTVKECLKFGQNRKAETKKVIEECDFFIALLSKESDQHDRYYHAEIKQALEIQKGKLSSQVYLIPIMIEPCDINCGDLGDLYHLKLYEDFRQGIKALLKTIDDKGRFLSKINQMESHAKGDINGVFPVVLRLLDRLYPNFMTISRNGNFSYDENLKISNIPGIEDSIKVMHFTFILEDALDISIPDGVLCNTTTVSEAIKLLESIVIETHGKPRTT